MLVPNKDVWTTTEFLRARKKQMEAERKRLAETPSQIEKDILAGGGEVIIQDMGDEVVCDTCNVDCLAGDPMPGFLHLVQYGSRVVCDECYERDWKGVPLRHRQLMSDGTLGPVLPHTRGADEEA